MKTDMLDVYAIDLDRDNPRIASFIEQFGDNLTSETVAFALDDSGSQGTTYSTLREAIKSNGGLISPIIVNQTSDGRCVVIEGNTRLKIYQEFLESGTAGEWSTIPAIIHHDMSENEIHATRLQAHLVGPRDWSPYAKAKYLHELSTKGCMTSAQIEDFCGGNTNKRAIRQLIDGYVDMEKYYRPLCPSDADFDTRKFSFFSELQSGGLIDALMRSNKTKGDFAEWVYGGKIDSAQNVRELKKILHVPAVANEFFNDPRMTVKAAMKKIYAAEIVPDAAQVTASLSVNTLVIALMEKLANLPYSEVLRLRKPESASEVDDFRNLNDFLDDFLEDCQPEE